MRKEQLAKAFEGLQGMLLMEIEDCDRQEQMDGTLEIIRGWGLNRITAGKMEMPNHPRGFTDVHLHFSDNGAEPEFVLGILARDVHSITVGEIVAKGGTIHTQASILLKRGHRVKVQLA